MTSVFDPKHKHHTVHKVYIERCFANPNDPPIVEVTVECVDESRPWITIPDPEWKEGCNYRIKPQTITRTISYPKPLTTLTNNQKFWYIAGHLNGPVGIVYDSNHMAHNLLKNGMCFATEEDAIASHKALFGTQE